MCPSSRDDRVDRVKDRHCSVNSIVYLDVSFEGQHDWHLDGMSVLALVGADRGVKFGKERQEMMKTAYAATAAALILAGCGGGGSGGHSGGSGGHSDAYNQGYNWAVTNQNGQGLLATQQGIDATCRQFVPAGLDQAQWIKGCTDELTKVIPASDLPGAPTSQP